MCSKKSRNMCKLSRNKISFVQIVETLLSSFWLENFFNESRNKVKCQTRAEGVSGGEEKRWLGVKRARMLESLKDCREWFRVF